MAEDTVINPPHNPWKFVFYHLMPSELEKGGRAGIAKTSMVWTPEMAAETAELDIPYHDPHNSYLNLELKTRIQEDLIEELSTGNPTFVGLYDPCTFHDNGSLGSGRILLPHQYIGCGRTTEKTIEQAFEGMDTSLGSYVVPVEEPLLRRIALDAVEDYALDVFDYDFYRVWLLPVPDYAVVAMIPGNDLEAMDPCVDYLINLSNGFSVPESGTIDPYFHYGWQQDGSTLCKIVEPTRKARNQQDLYRRYKCNDCFSDFTIEYLSENDDLFEMPLLFMCYDEKIIDSWNRIASSRPENYFPFG